MRGPVAVDDDYYDVMLMVSNPRLLAESLIYPHRAALTARPTKPLLRCFTLWGQSEPPHS